MAPAHTSTLTAAYQTQENGPLLPLFAYTAVGWHDGKFWAAGFRSDYDCRQDFTQFDQQRIDTRTARALKHFPDNRLIQHLGTCCLTYRCPAARNYFLERWEAPLPTSPGCNARCLGCISLQPSECCPSTQERLQFTPSVREVTEVGVAHLDNAARPVVSFGQGCEGEPLLQADLLESAIKEMRRLTGRGTINCNTNASRPESIARLREAARTTLTEWTRHLREEAGDDFPGGGTAFRVGMAVHGRFRETCPDCGSEVQRIRYAENAANYCPTCQTGGKLLADRGMSRLLREDWPRNLDELDRMRARARGDQDSGDS